MQLQCVLMDPTLLSVEHESNSFHVFLPCGIRVILYSSVLNDVDDLCFTILLVATFIISSSNIFNGCQMALREKFLSFHFLSIFVRHQLSPNQRKLVDIMAGLDTRDLLGLG